MEERVNRKIKTVEQDVDLINSETIDYSLSFLF